MGPSIIITDIEFHYGHLIQIDFLNESTNETGRLFIEATEFFKMLLKNKEEPQ